MISLYLPKLDFRLHGRHFYPEGTFLMLARRVVDRNQVEGLYPNNFAQVPGQLRNLLD